MVVEIWSDVVCPWCWIGKRRFERALAEFTHRDDVRVVHRSFQLNPALPKGGVMSRRTALISKYGLSDAEIQTRDERMEHLAADEGLDYDLSGTVTGNTAGAHQLLHLARDRGLQDAVLERFYRAYFSEQRSLFDDSSLVNLAKEAGLDPDEASEVLQQDTYAEAVKADIAQARVLRITGVPFFAIDRRYGISGARLPEAFRETLERAWTESAVIR